MKKLNEVGSTAIEMAGTSAIYEAGTSAVKEFGEEDLIIKNAVMGMISQSGSTEGCNDGGSTEGLYDSGSTNGVKMGTSERVSDDEEG